MGLFLLCGGLACTPVTRQSKKDRSLQQQVNRQQRQLQQLKEEVARLRAQLQQKKRRIATGRTPSQKSTPSRHTPPHQKTTPSRRTPPSPQPPATTPPSSPPADSSGPTRPTKSPSKTTRRLAHAPRSSADPTVTARPKTPPPYQSGERVLCLTPFPQEAQAQQTKRTLQQRLRQLPPALRGVSGLGLKQTLRGVYLCLERPLNAASLRRLQREWSAVFQGYRTTVLRRKKLQQAEGYYRLARRALQNKTTKKLALVLDDVTELRARGRYRNRSLARLLRANRPLTFAVMPDGRSPGDPLAFTKVAIERIISLRHARELRAPVALMLHMPMESGSNAPIALRPDMGLFLSDQPALIQQKLRRILRALRQHYQKQVRRYYGRSDPRCDFSGMNNHMGSRFTQDATKMSLVAQTLRQEGFRYFLDSLTHAHKEKRREVTRAVQARKLRYYKNTVFLDSRRRTYRYVSRQLRRAGRLALRQGQCIAIGHAQRQRAYRDEARAIADYVRLYRPLPFQGRLRFVRVVQLYNKQHVLELSTVPQLSPTPPIALARHAR